MYVKCGSMDFSLLVFFNLLGKKIYIFCWNSVIEGLVAHELAIEVLKMFDRMVREKVKSKRVTFMSVLEEGQKRFLSFTNGYSFAPKV